MNKDLFNPDIFSNSIPAFKKSNADITKLLKNIIAKNYNQISSNRIGVEQFQGNEINSNNYKVTTDSGIYLIKKFIDISEYSELRRILLLSNWLSNHHIKLGKVHVSNCNEFIVKSEVDNSFWCIFDFINGSFFTGRNDHELVSVSSEIGKLFKKLKKIPLELCPLDKINHFSNSEQLMTEMQNNTNNWILYFGSDLSGILADNWEFIKKIHSELIDNKKMISKKKATPCHIDLHPHNILVADDTLKSILDVDSIKLDYNLIPISFSMYKLLKQCIITRKIKNNPKEISRVTHIYFNSLIKEFSIAEKEIQNLYTYVAAEILRRIFIIFSLNLYKNDNRWNHILSTHLSGLKEAKIIFASLKSNKIEVIPKNILVRTDSSSTIGTGHIMRDLVLASKYKNSNIIFATQDLAGNINERIKEAGYKVKILQSNTLEEMVKLVEKYDIDLLVIDHYNIDYNYEKKLKKKTGVKILSFDDTYEKHYCDILLNHNISANKKRYKDLVPKSCELRCGSKYTLLRDEFIKERKKERKVASGKNKTVFLAMGGTDHSNINIEILEVLEKFDNLKVNLVTTTANKNLKELKENVKEKKWIKVHVNSNKIAKLMAKSDFSIVTPSVTLNEIYFMEIPFIAIKTAKNQDDMYKYLKKKKFLVLNKFKNEKLKKYVELLLNKDDKNVK